MDSKRIAQPNSAKVSKRRAFAFRSHNGPAPEIWSVNVGVFWSHIEITAHDQVTGFFLRDAITESPIPLQFVFICRRTDSLPVRRVNRKDAHVANRGGDYTRLRIDDFITKRQANLTQIALRENRHAVIRFLTMTSGVI